MVPEQTGKANRLAPFLPFASDAPGDFFCVRTGSIQQIHRFRRRWRLLLRCLAAVLVASCGWGSAYGQTPAGQKLSGPVVAIQVQPAPARTASQYLPKIVQKVGQPLDRVSVRESIQRLFATGEFANIEAVEYPAPGGIRLVFRTQPNYFIGHVQVANAPDPPASGELQDASRLELGRLYSQQAVAAAVPLIRERLQSFGYYQAQIQPRVSLNSVDALANIIFVIAPGTLVRLGTIQFKGEPLYAPDTLLRASHLKAGAELSRDRLDGAIQRLQKFYASQGRLAASIMLTGRTYVQAANRLNLVFQISAGPIVSVRAVGAKISSRTLRREVPVFQEHAADAELIEEGRRNLLDYLQNQGYYEATVDYRESRPKSGQLEIVYQVTPGPRESIDAIRFTGNHYFGTDELEDRLAIRTSTHLLPDIIPGARGRFSDALVQADANSISDLYQANGFSKVMVKPEINRAYQGKSNHIEVIFGIQEGPQLLVRNLKIEGNQKISNAQIEGLLTTSPSQPFSQINVATDRDSILSYYYNNGFQQAQCTSQTKSVPGKNLVDVTYRIEEGPLQTVNRVFITGERFVRTNVIGHQVRLKPGQPLSQVQMLNTQRGLYDLGLFTDVTVVPQNPMGLDQSKNVVVGVHETRRYTFAEGVGMQVQNGTGGSHELQNLLGSTRFSPLLSFDVTRLAFTGREQTLSFKSRYGALQKRAVLSYDVPRLLNHPNLKADVSALYDDTFDVNTFRSIRQQGGVQLEQKRSSFLRMLYRFDFRRVRVLDPLVAPQNIPLYSAPVAIAQGSVNLIRDRRDDPLNTTRGQYDTIGLSLAKSFPSTQLGSNIPTEFADFSRLTFQDAWYHPLGSKGQIVLARSTRLGILLPFGPEQEVTSTNPVTQVSTTSLQRVIPLPERFFSGGTDTLRGFAINQAGPRDPVTGFPIGGNALLINNLELRFPLIGQNIGGVLFYDLGNVYTTVSALPRALLRIHQPSITDLNYTSHTVGVGLRYLTPVGPIRLDLAYNLNPPTTQQFTGTTLQPTLQPLPHFHFFFSIGQTF